MFILFVDDDPEDTELYQEAIKYLNESEYLQTKESKLVCQTVNKCEDLLSFLANLKSPPDLIFLDINMPIIGGKDCLLSIKRDPKFARVPVVMLSTGCTPKETVNLKAAGAAECIQKPNDFKRLVAIFSKLIFERNL